MSLSAGGFGGRTAGGGTPREIRGSPRRGSERSFSSMISGGANYIFIRDARGRAVVNRLNPRVNFFVPRGIARGRVHVWAIAQQEICQGQPLFPGQPERLLGYFFQCRRHGSMLSEERTLTNALFGLFASTIYYSQIHDSPFLRTE